MKIEKLLEKSIKKLIFEECLFIPSDVIYYENTYYCVENKLIHKNIKQVCQCKSCITEQDKLEYEAKKRLEFLISGYFIHNLSSLYKNLSTERICELYNVKLNYFKPWL